MLAAHCVHCAHIAIKINTEYFGAHFHFLGIIELRNNFTRTHSSKYIHSTHTHNISYSICIRRVQLQRLRSWCICQRFGRNQDAYIFPYMPISTGNGRLITWHTTRLHTSKLLLQFGIRCSFAFNTLPRGCRKRKEQWSYNKMLNNRKRARKRKTFIKRAHKNQMNTLNIWFDIKLARLGEGAVKNAQT